MFLREMPALTVGLVIAGLSIQSSPLPGYHLSLVGTFFVQEALVMEHASLKEVFSDLGKTLAIRGGGDAEGTKHSHLTPVKERSPLLLFSSHKPTIEVYRSMKVTFRQSGGYTGLIKGCEIDTDLLPSDEAIRLQSLVEQSGILKAEGGQMSNARDLFDYEIIVEIGEEVHHVSFDSMSLPEDVAPLLEYLKSRAKPRPPR